MKFSGFQFVDLIADYGYRS